MLISIEGLNKSFGEEQILYDINLSIEEKGRYGLIGVNGAGKSTLLNVIMDELDFEDGEIYRSTGLSVGYLKQNNGLERDNTIIEQMRVPFQDAINAEKKMRKLEKEMAGLTDQESLEYKKIASEYNRAQNIFDSRDGYNIDVKIKTILTGMGFADKDMDTVINTLSGGEKTRLAIARLLLEEPNLLILDEPTNHLDFKTLRWLEEYLINYNGAILVVSHDRYFLDKTVDTIFEIERGRLVTYKGNYSKYLVLKEERITRLTKEYEAQQEEIKKLREYVDKNLVRASTSNMAKSRMKTLESMEIIEKPEGDLKKMKLRFDITHEPYKDVLIVEDLDVEVGEEKKLLSSGINLDIKRKEKIAVIGENGIGKSSLLKTILGIIPHTKGEIEWGKNTTISYYEQENLNLDPEKIALNELWDRFPDITETEIRKVLGSVLLSQDDVYKPVKVISGGERAKLAFAEIMLEKANVMLLDEPTNHLDLVSKEVLEKALMDYEGTLIFVSHDRYLLNKVPDKIVEITRNGAVVYNGGYDYYMEHLPKEEEPKKPKEEKEKTEKPKSDYRSKEQRKLDVQRKNRLKELEKLIEETETEIAETEQAMTEENVFSDYVKMNELCEKLENMKNKLEEYYEEWTLLGE